MGCGGGGGRGESGLWLEGEWTKTEEGWEEDRKPICGGLGTYKKGIHISLFTRIDTLFVSFNDSSL